MEHAENGQWREAVQHLLHVHRPGQAEQLVRRRLAQHPQEAAAYEMLALTLLNQSSRTPEALVAAQEALALDPQLADAHYFYSIALLRSNCVAEASQSIAEALRLSPRTPTYLGYRGVILNASGRSQEALQAAEAGLAVDPGHLECLYQRIMALRQLGRRRDAALTIQQLAQWHPNRVATHQLLGQEALRDQRIVEAEGHFREAIRLKPTSEQAHELLGRALEWQAETAFYQHNFSQVVSFCQEILLLKPKHPAASQLLKRALLRQHWSQQPFTWLLHRTAATKAAGWSVLIPLIYVWLGLPLLLAGAARAALFLRYAILGPDPIPEDSWFYIGVAWAIGTFALALFPPVPLPALWLAVVGGLIFPARYSWQKWQRGSRRWPLAATLLLSPGSLALINGHGNWLNSNGAAEAPWFLAIFAGGLLLYHLLRSSNQPVLSLPA